MFETKFETNIALNPLTVRAVALFLTKKIIAKTTTNFLMETTIAKKKPLLPELLPLVLTD